ncbi:hypothetical protein [Trichormus variabilis]|uniref:Uncharacterized protein n=1 Tax=Trichormus variabilis N2B TaxID=2681315 RepID=A0ABR6S890_ANAVA|nr:hypothetical protein [Trichormus variabilis]MBC1302622.1 hypothetical protein [Trichormus variabilis N2B]
MPFANERLTLRGDAPNVATATLTAVATSRGTRRQSLQVGKAAHSAVSPTHCLTTDN